MTDAIWQAMMKTNARMVAVLCGAFFVVVLLLAVWESGGERKLQFINDPVPVDLSLPGTPMETDWEALTAGKVEDNPFHSPYLDDLLRREAERVVREEGGALANISNSADRVEVGYPPDLLLYRGMMRRPDGQVMGMIENLDSGEVAFYAEGMPFMDWTVRSITRDALHLADRDGVNHVLTVGVPEGMGRVGGGHAPQL